MNRESLYQESLELTQRSWNLEPVKGVRMPVLDRGEPVSIDALWTDGGLRPSANNLAFLIQQIFHVDEIAQWKQRLEAWPIRGGLLVTQERLHLLKSSAQQSSDFELTVLDLDDWRSTLVSPKPHLFTPKALAKFKEGQLSLADLEETVSERSFTFLTRQQSRIDTSFQQGISEALNIVGRMEVPSSSRTEVQGHVIRYSIAYLAARILQDKNFFGAGSSIHDEDQDPINLLNRMIDLTNGFFKRAKKSEEFVNERVRQALVQHMGYNVSFVLADHRDVGRLYERAIRELPAPTELSGEAWGDLNRHYTPVKIAEKMLEALPLERLRPEERYIFDPASGSGSLLLAATSRLASMSDIPTGTDRNSYLSSHVAGNDLDQYATLIARLRYFLASESLAKADSVSQITDVLPFPIKENLTYKDYELIDRAELPIKPKVIVANPPFSESGGTQKAASFVRKALSWMDDGSQFAFVLPQSFLTNTTHGVPDARAIMDDRCQILETWQFPEGTIGTNARQSTCVVVGTVGKSRKSAPIISKAIFSGAEINEIRENGFLGQSWLTQPKTNEALWEQLTAPTVKQKVSTVPLGNLFYVFGGVTPLAGISALRECPTGKRCKLNWKLSWKGQGKLWADPTAIPEDQRWIIYEPEYLYRDARQNSELFDSHKLLVSRIANRNSSEPLVVRLDTTGFCPDNNVFCILPITETEKYNAGFSEAEVPASWRELTIEQQRLLLLGILSSEFLNRLSLVGRNARELPKKILLQLPLPIHFDEQIIRITNEIIQTEQSYGAQAITKKLRHQLNERVETSYGKPTISGIKRTGRSSDLLKWKTEQPNKAKTAIGHVLNISQDESQIYMYISRLMEDDDADGEWIPLPQELPGWALDGTAFEAELSADVRTFAQLRERPWALRNFRHTPRPYLTDQELNDFLTIPELEVRS